MVTPSANRNTYSIAISFYILTQGRGASPRNPGLGNRNSYRVAKGGPSPVPEAPPHPSPRGGSPNLLCLRVFVLRSPLGESHGGAFGRWGGASTVIVFLPA